MNAAVGSDYSLAIMPGTVSFFKRADFAKMPYPMIFVFIDVNEDYLDYCHFFVGVFNTFDAYSWGYLPAGRHAGSGVLSYQDGSAEIHLWRDPGTLQPVTGVYQWSNVAKRLPGTQDDWRYLAERFTFYFKPPY